MANTFLTPSLIAKAALANLYANTVMAQLVYRDYDADFSGAQGATITVRKPAVFTANTFNRSSGIVVQDATESSFTVSLNTLLDVSFAVTAEDLTLTIQDFNEQLLNPAMMAIAQGIDQALLALRSDVTQTVGTLASGTLSGDLWIDARTKLNQAKVPLTGRSIVFDPRAEGNVLKDHTAGRDFLTAEKVGDDGTALREASLGRKLGMDTFVDQNVTDNKSVAFHETAFALVTRTLAKPQGVAEEQVSVMDYKGFAVRVVRAYDVTKKQDIISVDTLIGVKTMDASRAVLLLN